MERDSENTTYAGQNPDYETMEQIGGRARSKVRPHCLAKPNPMVLVRNARGTISSFKLEDLRSTHCQVEPTHRLTESYL